MPQAIAAALVSWFALNATVAYLVAYGITIPAAGRTARSKANRTHEGSTHHDGVPR